MKKTAFSLSIVIPAFNEEKRIPSTIKRIQEYLSEQKMDFEIVIIDDGSEDKTVAKVGHLIKTAGNIKLFKNSQNKGKGFSVKKGILNASGDIILLSDADLSTPIEEFEKLLSVYDEGIDIVIGSRGLYESHIIKRQPWYRENMGKIFNLLVRALVIGGFKDTQCGFKIFNRDAAKRIFKKCRIKGFCFDVEALFIAKKEGFNIQEIPVKWINSPNSRVRIVQDSFRMFIDLFRIRLNWLRGAYR